MPLILVVRLHLGLVSSSFVFAQAGRHEMQLARALAALTAPDVHRIVSNMLLIWCADASSLLFALRRRQRKWWQRRSQRLSLTRLECLQITTDRRDHSILQKTCFAPPSMYVSSPISSALLSVGQTPSSESGASYRALRPTSCMSEPGRLYLRALLRVLFLLRDDSRPVLAWMTARRDSGLRSLIPHQTRVAEFRVCLCSPL